MRTSTLFQLNRADRFPLKKNEVGQPVTSFLNKTAEKVVPCFMNKDEWGFF